MAGVTASLTGPRGFRNSTKKTATDQNATIMFTMGYNNVLMECPELFEKKFSILQEISSAIVLTDNITATANLMLDLAINYTNAEKGSLMLSNKLGELYILAARGIDLQLIKNYKVRIGEGIAGRVARDRVPVLVEDIDNDERFEGTERDRYRTRSFISCPIVSKGKLLGVININDKKDGTPFVKDELTLITIIANQAAIALENAFLMNQLRSKAAELEDINRRLIEADETKTEFITSASHELRTPLNSIKGAVYYLQQSKNLTSEEQREFYGIISHETGKLISIVENLLDFLRIEDETQLTRKSLISLEEVLNEIFNSRSLNTITTRKNLRLNRYIQGGVSDIVGDKIRIVQFFINLIEGISHYLDRGAALTINVTENDHVEVKLTASTRLPEEVAQHLFNSEPLKSGHIFQSGEPEERLKLYLARKVAELHNWALRTDNREDAFEVTVTIPKCRKDRIEAVVDSTVDKFIDFISELLNIDICSIMLCDELTGELRIKSARGLDEDVIKRTRISLGDRIAGWVALEGKPLLIEDIEKDERFGRKSILQYNTKSLLSLPLTAGNRVIGVLNLNNKKSADPFTTKDLHIASVVSKRISHFIEELYGNGYSEDDFKQFTAALDSLISAERRYHKKSSLFPDLMEKILDRLGVNGEDRSLALYISKIYDLGLMLVDESILKKKNLSPIESRTLKLHPFTTIDLLNNLEYSAHVKESILHHHERYGGRGYPDGLKGEEIPLISRVLAVIDAFCAMTTDRPYRKAYTRDEALMEIKEGAGTIYDPRVVEALESALQEE